MFENVGSINTELLDVFDYLFDYLAEKKYLIKN